MGLRSQFVLPELNPSRIAPQLLKPLKQNILHQAHRRPSQIHFQIHTLYIKFTAVLSSLPVSTCYSTKMSSASTSPIAAGAEKSCRITQLFSSTGQIAGSALGRANFVLSATSKPDVQEMSMDASRKHSQTP